MLWSPGEPPPRALQAEARLGRLDLPATTNQYLFVRCASCIVSASWEMSSNWVGAPIPLRTLRRKTYRVAVRPVSAKDHHVKAPTRITFALASIALLLTAACGGGDADDNASDSGSGVSSNIAERTADIEPCTLLTDADLTAIIGTVPTAEESTPAGPFTGCSWGLGIVRLSIATSDHVILAPGEDECPSADLGEESYQCEGRIKLLTNGIHLTVSTSDRRVTSAHLLAFTEVVLPRLQP